MHSAVDFGHLFIAFAHLVNPRKACPVKYLCRGERSWCLGAQQSAGDEDAVSSYFLHFLTQACVWKAKDPVLDCASRFLKPSVSAPPHDLILQRSYSDG